jgi:hypothetical protein
MSVYEYRQVIVKPTADVPGRWRAAISGEPYDRDWGAVLIQLGDDGWKLESLTPARDPGELLALFSRTNER